MNRVAPGRGSSWNGPKLEAFQGSCRGDNARGSRPRIRGSATPRRRGRSRCLGNNRAVNARIRTLPGWGAPSGVRNVSKLTFGASAMAGDAKREVVGESVSVTKKSYGLEHGLTNYGDRDFSLYLRRSCAQSMGYSRALLAKPVVGIAYTPSGFNNCHRHFPDLLEAVRRGVLAAGALPIAFPTISLGEVFLSPTSLKYRNLMSIDTEEMIRAQPMDAVVLMGGCDKTVPAQLMGAVSAGRPAIMLVAGPMMTGRHKGERLGACTDCRRFWARYRAGDVDAAEISQVEGQLAVTAGTCAVMGTASTMACLAEALGMILPGTAAI